MLSNNRLTGHRVRHSKGKHKRWIRIRIAKIRVGTPARFPADVMLSGAAS